MEDAFFFPVPVAFAAAGFFALLLPAAVDFFLVDFFLVVAAFEAFGFIFLVEDALAVVAFFFPDDVFLAAVFFAEVFFFGELFFFTGEDEEPAFFAAPFFFGLVLVAAAAFLEDPVFFAAVLVFFAGEREEEVDEVDFFFTAIRKVVVSRVVLTKGANEGGSDKTVHTTWMVSVRQDCTGRCKALVFKWVCGVIPFQMDC